MCIDSTAKVYTVNIWVQRHFIADPSPLSFILSSIGYRHGMGWSFCFVVCMPNPPPVSSIALSPRASCNSRELLLFTRTFNQHVSFYTARRCSVWGFVPPMGDTLRRSLGWVVSMVTVTVFLANLAI